MVPMPHLDSEEVARLASLARIRLTDEEISRFAGEFDAILHAVESVSEVATDDIPATSHPIPLTNVFRDDVVRDTLSTESALDQAPASDQDRFLVPQILGEEA
jgi:aspartyl-tRNA(Asn)/glutamyl-tRNA(Gln) amidotransferase subunit C